LCRDHSYAILSYYTYWVINWHSYWLSSDNFSKRLQHKPPDVVMPDVLSQADEVENLIKMPQGDLSEAPNLLPVEI
jgi:hypothetical protein